MPSTLFGRDLLALGPNLLPSFRLSRSSHVRRHSGPPLAAPVAPFPAVVVLIDELASSSSNLAPTAWDCSDSSQAKSLVDVLMLAPATHVGAVPFFKALPRSTSCPSSNNRGNPRSSYPGSGCHGISASFSFVNALSCLLAVSSVVVLEIGRHVSLVWFASQDGEISLCCFLFLGRALHSSLLRTSCSRLLYLCRHPLFSCVDLCYQ